MAKSEKFIFSSAAQSCPPTGDEGRPAPPAGQELEDSVRRIVQEELSSAAGLVNQPVRRSGSVSSQHFVRPRVTLILLFFPSEHFLTPAFFSSEPNTVSMKAMVGGCPPFLGTPEDFRELNSQFLAQVRRKHGTCNKPI